ncbi:hypothetical protein O181_030515 [Austropuccinia psidii MF-1]|uniref:Chromo domain-containing protein n=1 Tax=Austropuccinia psidii MF-1 TaxID=1389203 RepID=A0A9Q3CWD1_9BASI|nr:hypothetical protein [Austropuccinia psidii MF-1]
MEWNTNIMKDIPMTGSPFYPEIQLDYNTSQHSTTGKSPFLVEKGWNALLPVYNLKKIILTIHPTAKDFHVMWNRECETAERCIALVQEYKKQSHDNTNKEPDFREGDQVLIDREKFSGGKTDRRILYETPSVPSGFVQSFPPNSFNRFPSRNKSHTPQDIVEVEDFPGPVKKIMKAGKIRLNVKDHRQYLVRLKNQTADKDRWLAEDAIPNGEILLRGFRVSWRSEKSHQL